VPLKYTFHFPSIFLMNTTKINKLLKALPSDVVAQFGKTLKPKTAIQRLFMYLNNPKKDLFDTDKMSRYVFQKQRANPSKSLQNEGYKLYEELEQWLIQQELKADELTQNQLLSKALKRYKATDAYFKTLQKREELIEAQTHRDMWYHLDWMRLAHEQYFDSTKDFGSAEAAENFAEIKHHFDEFCTLGQLVYLMEQHSRHTIFKSPKIWKESKKYAVNANQKPLVQLYNLLLNINQNNDNELYKYSFLPTLEKYINELSPEDRSTLINLQLNYIIRRIRAGDMDFINERYKAYRIALDKGYLEHDRSLYTGHFLNAVITAAVLEEFEWCEQLILSASDRLKGEVENTVRLAWAFFHFYKKDINKTRQLLDEITFENINYRLRKRSLNAQYHYEFFRMDEEKDTEPLMYFLNAYEQFIGREKKRISDDICEANINFINLLKKMVNQPHRSKKILTDTLQNTEKQLIAKIWLWTLVEE